MDFEDGAKLSYFSQISQIISQNNTEVICANPSLQSVKSLIIDQVIIVG